MISMFAARSSILSGALVVVALGWGRGTVPLSSTGSAFPSPSTSPANEVVYSREKQTASARALVEVMDPRRDKPDQWVKITPAKPRPNLATGVTDASAGVRIETPAGIFTARTVHMDPPGVFW